jgi:hypothetical protein
MLAPPPRPLTRPRQKVILLTALVAALVEIAGLLELVPRINLGRLVISPSIVPALVVVALLGRRIAGRARDIDAAATYWLTVGAGLFLSTILLDREGHLLDALAIAIAALDEEVIYRFAVPAVVAAVLVVFHVPSRPSRMIGLAVAAIWFVLLPGHRTQVHTVADVLPFVAFATLAAIVVYRSGSILATAATHAVMNMLTIISFGGDMTQTARAVATGVLLLLLVSGYGFVRPRASGPEREDETVIDLRDGVTPSVSQDGGPPRPVARPAPEPAREPQADQADTSRRIG